MERKVLLGAAKSVVLSALASFVVVACGAIFYNNVVLTRQERRLEEALAKEKSLRHQAESDRDVARAAAEKAEADERQAAAVKKFFVEEILLKGDERETHKTEEEQPKADDKVESCFRDAEKVIRERFADNPSVAEELLRLSARQVAADLHVSDLLIRGQRLLESRGKMTPRLEFEVRDTLGRAFYTLGRFQPAAEQLTRSHALAGELYGPKSPVAVRSLSYLALATGEQGKRDEAIPLFQSVLALRTAALGEHHAERIQSAANLAAAFALGGRYAEAAEVDDKLLAVCKAELGEDDPVTLQAANRVGVYRHRLQRVEEAVEIHQDVYERRMRLHGPNHVETDTSLMNLARAYGAFGQWDRAAELYAVGLRRRQDRLGPAHLLTLDAMEEYSVALEYQKQYEEAAAIQQEQLQLRIAAVPPNEGRAHDVRVRLAQIYYELGRLDEAIPLLQVVRDYWERTSGEWHINTIRSHCMLALYAHKHGKLDLATPSWERVAAAHRKKIGNPNVPEFLNHLLALEDCYRGLNRYEDAVAIGEERVRLSSSFHGPQKAETLEAKAFLADSLDRLERYDEAIALSTEVLDTTRSEFGPKDPLTLKRINQLAVIHHNAGRMPQAIDLYEKSLALRREVLQPNDSGLFEAYENLGNALNAVERSAEAATLYETAWRLRAAAQGDDHPQTLKTQRSVAVVHSRAGNLARAIDLYGDLKARQTALHGPDHEDTLLATRDLAIQYAAVGQFPEAVVQLQAILNSRETTSGYTDPATWKAMDELANVLVKNQEFAKSAELQARSLDLRRKRLGDKDPETLQAMNRAAMNYSNCGLHREALTLLEQSLDLHQAVHGKTHAATLQTMNDLGLALSAAKSTVSGLRWLETVLLTRSQILGAEHPDTLQSMQTTADANSKAGRHERAAQLYTMLLKIVSESERPKIEPLLVKSRLADVCEAARDFDRVIELREQVLAERERRQGPNHPLTIQCLDLLARALTDGKRFSEAVLRHEELVRRRILVQGERHPLTLTARHNLAESYRGTQQYDESVEVFLDVIRLSRLVLKADHPDTRHSVSALARTYYYAGDHENAIATFEEAIREADRVLSAGNDESLALLRELAVANTKGGRLDAAADTHRQRIERIEKRFGPAHQHAFTATDEFVQFLLNADRKQEAAEALASKLQFCRDELGANALQTIRLLHYLGRVERLRKKFAESETLLLEAHRQIPVFPPQERPEAASIVIEELSELYDDWDKKEDAARWRKQLPPAKTTSPK